MRLLFIIYLYLFVIHFCFHLFNFSFQKISDPSFLYFKTNIWLLSGKGLDLSYAYKNRILNWIMWLLDVCPRDQGFLKGTRNSSIKWSLLLWFISELHFYYFSFLDWNYWFLTFQEKVNEFSFILSFCHFTRIFQPFYGFIISLYKSQFLNLGLRKQKFLVLSLSLTLCLTR